LVVQSVATVADVHCTHVPAEHVVMPGVWQSPLTTHSTQVSVVGSQ